MEVRTLVKKGSDHSVYCEDSVFFQVRDSENISIGAIFDGCSTGLQSHFASSLLAKVVKYSINSRIEKEYSIQFIMHLIIVDLFYKIKQIKAQLTLLDLELVSTFIIAIVKDDNVYIASSGDGVIKVDDNLIILESPENAPDYMAYHLDGDFEDFINKHINFYDFKFTKDVSICSDGITSFRSSIKEDVTSEAVDTFLNDRSLMNSDAMLARKYNIFKKKGYDNFDDVAIVRFIKE